MATNYSKYINSTGTHYISNSGSDESGSLHSGKAGDQTGKEWQLRTWYNRPWTIVLRYPDQAVALKIAELGIDAALNDKIGYDQYQRTTYWAQLKAVGYDPSKITTACEEDCTAGVTANCKAAGFIFGLVALQNLSTSITSRNMKPSFLAAGFKALTASKYLTGTSYLLPGDILLYENHHAATNITCGVSARGEWKPGNTPKYEIKLGDRELQRGDVGEDVKELQNSLIKLGWSFPKYGPDGDFGSETETNVKGFQRVNGIDVDGVFGPESYRTLVGALEKLNRYVEITGGTVNVRTAPNTSGNIIGVAQKGKKLLYQGQKSADGWYLVEFDNKNGWVSGKYGKLVE